MWPSLPRRNLDRAELQVLVDDLADQPDRWREHVVFGGGQRHYVSLHRDEYVDVWLLCWTREDDTGWHDHDISSGAVRVVLGTVNLATGQAVLGGGVKSQTQNSTRVQAVFTPNSQ